MAKHFGYYDGWKSAILECPCCGWKGPFEQGSVEHHEALMDSSCPVCDWLQAPMLAIVSYPTIQESEQNWSQLTAEEKRDVAARKQFHERWEAAHLRAPDQLPELDGPDLTLVWDCIEEAAGWVTVLRQGDIDIWREPALYEGYERFREIVVILKQKYGARLVDVVPTSASELYLYGDRWSALAHVRATLQLVMEGRSPLE